VAASAIPGNFSRWRNSNPLEQRTDSLSEDQLDDSVLVSRCKHGQFTSFNTLVDRHKSGVFNMALRMLGHYQDASDVMQDAFVKAFENLHSFQERSAFRTWLYSIAIRECLNYRRKRMVATGRAVPYNEEMDDRSGPSRVGKADEGPVAMAMRKETMERVTEELSALGPQYRATFVLRDLEGLEYAEIARVLGVSVGTVKSRLHRARSQLAERMKDIVE
jgi:RNA polymerase sigma-70 factor (ECF subfamily)